MLRDALPMDPKRDVVIVTGSSGLIGSATAERLSERFAVVGFDREGPPHPPPSVDCVSVDITSTTAFARDCVTSATDMASASHPSFTWPRTTTFRVSRAPSTSR